MTSLYCSQGHQNALENQFCSACGEKLSRPATDPGGTSLVNLVGLVLGGRYRALRQLGQGGFGRTYLAEDGNRFNEPCVLKEFAPEVRGESLEKAKELFEREAGVLYQLQHPQIPRFRELFRVVLEHERLFLVQDYVEGATYRQLLDQRGCFSETEVRHLLAQILPVLDYIHSLGVVHRDLSPENLILRTRDQLPVLIDFGGVKQIAAAAVSEYMHQEASSAAETLVPPTRLGKMGYAPFEQMHQGMVSPQSDLYALAMTALVLLTGQDPTTLVNPHQDPEHLRSTIPALSPDLAVILTRMLAPQPAERFPSAQAVLAALFSPSSPESQPPTTALGDTPTVPVFVQSQFQPQFQPQYPHPDSLLQPDRDQPLEVSSISHRRPSRLPLLLLPLLLLPLAAWWWRDYWLPYLPSLVAQSPNSDPSTPDTPPLSLLERQAQAAEINYDFLIKLTDASFAKRYPAQAGRVLSDSDTDREWRRKWGNLADEWLTVLPKHLSSEARQKLGSYSEADRNQWKPIINQFYVGSRSLYDLTDAQFKQRFPKYEEMLQSPDFLNQPIGQVWQALATEQIQSLQTGQTLEKIEFAPGSFSHQTSNTLPAGGGRIYTANLAAEQIMRLNIQAPARSSLLSIYLPRPTADQSVLLEDSTEVTWIGTLPQSGYYEVVIINTAKQPIRYQLTLAVDNVTSTPVEPEAAEQEAPEAKD